MLIINLIDSIFRVVCCIYNNIHVILAGSSSLPGKNLLRSQTERTLETREFVYLYKILYDYIYVLF